MAKTDKNGVAEATAELETEKTVDTFENAAFLSGDVKAQVAERIKTLKAEKKIKRIFAIAVQGDEEDEKPYFIGYFQNPTIMHFSQYMSFVTKDAVQAALNLAKGTFIDGDRELIDDDDVFLRGTFDRFSSIMERRNSSLVKA